MVSFFIASRACSIYFPVQPIGQSTFPDRDNLRTSAITIKFTK